MKITLSNYRPFAFTRGAIDTAKKFGKEPHHNCAELALKVARVALACLVLPFAFLLDLVLSPVAALYQRCWTKTAPKPPVHRLTPAEKILSNPYSGSKGIPYESGTFLEDAIRLGLSLNERRIPLISRLIGENIRINNGPYLLPNSYKLSIDLWVANCLVAHYFVARSHYSGDFPSYLYPQNTNNDIRYLYDQFLQLSLEDRSAALLEVVCPTGSYPKTDTLSGSMADRIRSHARELIGTPNFRELFQRAQGNIQAIADNVAKGSKSL